MTRTECEKQILQKMNEINKIVNDYNPCNKYISLSIVDDIIMFNNNYWVTDNNTDNNKIDYFGHIKE